MYGVRLIRVGCNWRNNNEDGSNNARHERRDAHREKRDAHTAEVEGIGMFALMIPCVIDGYVQQESEQRNVAKRSNIKIKGRYGKDNNSSHMARNTDTELFCDWRVLKPQSPYSSTF